MAIIVLTLTDMTRQMLQLSNMWKEKCSWSSLFNFDQQL